MMRVTVLGPAVVLIPVWEIVEVTLPPLIILLSAVTVHDNNNNIIIIICGADYHYIIIVLNKSLYTFDHR